jgi:hypothetical protein
MPVGLFGAPGWKILFLRGLGGNIRGLVDGPLAQLVRAEDS